MEEMLYDVRLTDTETGNKLRLRVRARSAIEAAAKLDGALIGPGCAYVLRKVEPSAAGRLESDRSTWAEACEAVAQGWTDGIEAGNQRPRGSN